MRKTLVIAALCLTMALQSEAADVNKARILLAPLTGTVGVQMEEFVHQTFSRARDEGCELVILQLDTPGGLVEAMRGIVQAILASDVPVVVWVPLGGRAASAGAFIVQAAHVAAMAEGTNIGAAHPVRISGGDMDDDEGESDMSKKVMNDLLAQMRSVVQLRGRNQDAAEQMIEESISLTAKEALSEGVIDVIANDVRSLVSAISGRVINGTRFDFQDVQIIRSGMSWREQVIQFVSSPEIAYLLLSGGLMAIFFEVITPGGFVLGTLGGVMLLLGSIGLKMLPFNWAGFLLMGAGVLLVVVDLMVGGIGVLSLIGLPVLFLGGVFLFQAPGGELLRISMSAVAGIVLAFVICLFIVAFLAIRSIRRKVTTGVQGMIGLEVEVLSDVRETAPSNGEQQEERGTVRCQGEIWSARLDYDCPRRALTKGMSAVVVAVDGMTLVVSVSGALPPNTF